MTTPDPTDLDQKLQAAVAAALETLVTLASDRSDPGQARLAATEILRFAARRKPEPAPAPQPREQVQKTRTVAADLNATLSVNTGTLNPMTPALPSADGDDPPAAATSTPTNAAPPPTSPPAPGRNTPGGATPPTSPTHASDPNTRPPTPPEPHPRKAYALKPDVYSSCVGRLGKS